MPELRPPSDWSTDEYKNYREEKVYKYIYNHPSFLDVGSHKRRDWLPAYDLPFALSLEENLVGLEIGTSWGHSTNFFMEMLPGLVMHAVDPYEKYEQMDDTEQAYESFQKIMELHPNKIILHRKRSDDAVDDFEDEMFDFIFIDGFHSYDQVKKDIINYYPKLKEGGHIFGHDYKGWGTNSQNCRNAGLKGVDAAVDEMAAKYIKEVRSCNSDCWFWRK